RGDHVHAFPDLHATGQAGVVTEAVTELGNAGAGAHLQPLQLPADDEVGYHAEGVGPIGRRSATVAHVQGTDQGRGKRIDGDDGHGTDQGSGKGIDVDGTALVTRRHARAV